MNIHELHYEQLHPWDVAHLSDPTQIALKAAKDQTPEQRAEFRQSVMKMVEADRLLLAQQVQIFIVGSWAQLRTPWGELAISNGAFEESAIDALLEASNND